jgi:ribosomal silencing factor RsfS
LQASLPRSLFVSDRSIAAAIRCGDSIEEEVRSESLKQLNVEKGKEGIRHSLYVLFDLLVYVVHVGVSSSLWNY